MQNRFTQGFIQHFITWGCKQEPGGVTHGYTRDLLNDIAQAAPGVQVKLFADDTNLFLSGIDISELICRSNNCLESLNRLHMNFEKKRMLWFFPSVKVMLLISALMDFLLQNYIAVGWYLGLHIDDELTWKSHIDVVYNKLQG